MAIEALAVCTAAGVCSGGAGTAAVSGGFFILGTTKDVALKIYYLSRAAFDSYRKEKYDAESDEGRFYSHRERQFREKSKEIQLTTDRVIKAASTGILIGGAAYIVANYIL